MLLDFDFEMLDRDGVGTGQFAYKTLYFLLDTKTPGVEMRKANEWASALQKNQRLELDRADVDKLENFLKMATDSKEYSLLNLFAGQIMEVLEEARDLERQARKAAQEKEKEVKKANKEQKK